MRVKSDIKYIGVNDHTIDLFEGMYTVPNGMSYNSYAILDEKIAIMDSVDMGFAEEWLNNIQNVLENRKPDYLIVQHMEPDHSANIKKFIKKYPETTIVASVKAFMMMENFFGADFTANRIVVSDGDGLSLGNHKLQFATAPMVHWPEVIVTFDSTEKVLFSADAFGKFGALDVEEEWNCHCLHFHLWKYEKGSDAACRKVKGERLWRGSCQRHCKMRYVRGSCGGFSIQ